MVRAGTGTHLRAGIVASLPTSDWSSVDLARLSAATFGRGRPRRCHPDAEQVISEIPRSSRRSGLTAPCSRPASSARMSRPPASCSPAVSASATPSCHPRCPRARSPAHPRFYSDHSLDLMVSEWAGNDLLNQDEVPDWWSQQFAAEGEFFLSDEVFERGPGDARGFPARAPRGLVRHRPVRCQGAEVVRRRHSGRCDLPLR